MERAGRLYARPALLCSEIGKSAHLVAALNEGPCVTLLQQQQPNWPSCSTPRIHSLPTAIVAVLVIASSLLSSLLDIRPPILTVASLRICTWHDLLFISSLPSIPLKPHCSTISPHVRSSRPVSTGEKIWVKWTTSID